MRFFLRLMLHFQPAAIRILYKFRIDMRDLVYYVASTLDGFIARKDGSLDGFPWDEKYAAELSARFPETFPAHLRREEDTPSGNKQFDAVLMGRKTYEVGLKEGITNPYPTLDQYLFSRTLEESPDERVELIRDNAVEAVRKLKQKPGKDIWLCGGAELAAAFLKAGLIDRMIVKVNPVIFGSGIPLFSGDVEPTDLELTDSSIFESGHALLDYRVRG